ncbi:hypothetical protein OS965_31585, partial [Streptomyces sp. H27-G5]|nr:hypothetical protein [Streptomyces sp. H27-G5]
LDGHVAPGTAGTEPPHRRVEVIPQVGDGSGYSQRKVGLDQGPLLVGEVATCHARWFIKSDRFRGADYPNRDLDSIQDLKLNGRLISRSPLSDVLELEAIRVGVEGKKELWRALRIVSRFDPRIDGEAMGRLLARAERQADALETLRLTAVEGAFDARAHRRPRGVTPRPHPRMT